MKCLRRGWSAPVGDYTIEVGWTVRGEALVAGDAAGGVDAFDGKSGVTITAAPSGCPGRSQPTTILTAPVKRHQELIPW